LVDRLAQGLRGLLGEKAKELYFQILALEIKPDHLHLFVESSTTLDTESDCVPFERLYFEGVAEGVSLPETIAFPLDKELFCLHSWFDIGNHPEVHR